MTIKRNCNLVALFVLGLLCIPINSEVFAMQQGARVGQVVGDTARNTGTFVGDTARNTGEFVGSTAENVGEFVGNTAENIGQAIDRGMETAGRVVEQGMQAVDRGVQTAGRVVQQGAETAGRVVQQGQQIAGTVARQGAQIVGGGIRQGVETVGSIGGQVVQTAGSGVRQGMQTAGSIASQGMQTAGAVAGQAVKLGGAVVGQGVQTVGAGVTTGADLATQGVQTVGRVIQQGMQTAGDVASKGVQTGAAISRGAMQIEGTIAKTGLDVAQKGVKTVGDVARQAIQTGTELSKEGIGLRGTLERGAVDLAGTTVGTGIGVAGDVVRGQVGIVGSAISQGVETGAHVIETVGKGVIQAKEQVQGVVSEAAQSTARTGSIVGTSAQKTGAQLEEVFGGIPEIADTAVSGVTEGFQNAFLGIFGKSSAGFPPVLKKKNIAINIVTPRGAVYLNDAKTLCVGQVRLNDPRAQFVIAREQAPYFWFRSVKFPKEMLRHIPKGTVGAGATEYTMISKAPDFGWETGGAWERVYVVDGKYIMTTRWDGSITEPGGYLHTNDGITLTSKNAAGNDYAFTKGEALPFIFVEAGSKDAESLDLAIAQRIEYAKVPPLTAAQIASLPAGTKVTVQSAVDSKYLECPGMERMDMFGDTSSWATFSCDDPINPSAQFVLQKSGKFVGFQASNGKLLESISPDLKGQPAWVVPGSAERFEGAALWTVLQKANNICLKNEITGGCLNNRGIAARTHEEGLVPAKVENAASNLIVRLAPGQNIKVLPTVAQPVVSVQPVIEEQPIVQTQPVIAPTAELWADIGSNFMNLGGAQVIAHPSMAPFNKFVFKSAWYSSDSVAAFTFKAAAKQDVVIMLASAMDQTSGDAVRIFTLGGYNNTTIIARPDAGGPIIKPVDGMTILDGEDSYVQFWITYDKSNGMATVGKGGVVGSNVLVSWKDPSPLKSDKLYLGVGAWFDPKMGSKVFYNNISVIPSVGGQPAYKEEIVTKPGMQQGASAIVQKVVPATSKKVTRDIPRTSRKNTKTPKTVAVQPVVTQEVEPVVDAAVVTTEQPALDIAPATKVQTKRQTRTSGKTQAGAQRRTATQKTRGKRETTDVTKPLVDRMQVPVQ